ncbi:twin-arginine translocase TatA/TatE family subunit [Brachybacterium vulturis]|uniref:Sec-independent protein translocase protein TatA n=1 Tax=Brachybacterium vulturis TaxID=2017484 RepID=A0A291GP23_9MICO|nr:Sec-independent protein translocase subunit TatA [Brachybacterium vulturis]ATG51975.1 twin-arginine translocase TatA/TatE family subunit [Brachybacterium vulturis]
MNFFRNPWAIVLLIVLVILLFGANKLPGLARNMGKSMRIFKSEVEELRGDDKPAEADEDEELDRPSRSSRSRDDRREGDARDTRDDRDDRRARDDREYDPRDDRDHDREPIRSRDDDDSYRRD